MVKLFFFGCWGYLGEGSGLKNVFASLNKTVGNGDHVVILGDNYYPSEKIESEGGKKNYFTSFNEIREIFEYLKILRTKNCHIHVLMGNHEYKDDTLTLRGYYDKKSQGGGLKLIQTGDPSKFKTFALEYGFIKTLGLDSDIGMCPIEGLPHTLLLKLDTNMFAIDKHNKKVTLPYEYNGNFTARSLIGNQDFSDIQRVFICGHIPIVSKIYKKEKHKLDQSLPIELYDLMFELVKNIKSKNEGIKIYYMCADTHYFQKVKIEMKRDDESYELEQFVAGTGGTKLDPWTEDKNEETDYDRVKGQTEFHYKIIETQREHGYVIVMDTEEPKFVPVSPHVGGLYKEVKSGKSKRKTKKRKTKKLKRKSNRKTNKRKTNKRKTKRNSKKHK
jgi:hypothetical protein